MRGCPGASGVKAEPFLERARLSPVGIPAGVCDQNQICYVKFIALKLNQEGTAVGDYLSDLKRVSQDPDQGQYGDRDH